MKRLLAAAAAIAAGYLTARLLLRRIDHIDWSWDDDRGDLADVQPFWLDGDDAAYREAVRRGG